jgi:hypothetical protein
LAHAFNDVVAAGYKRPVIVGGAAVEFYSGGAIVSGDFDIVTDVQQELERALIAKGFIRPSGIGTLVRGLHHPALALGMEVVSGALFDGAADDSRIVLVPMGDGEIAFPSVEDLIADRMGQFNSPTRHDEQMLGQAVVLYRIAREGLVARLDEVYLDRRIRDETAGDYGLAFLKEKSDAEDNDRTTGGSDQSMEGKKRD